MAYFFSHLLWGFFLRCHIVHEAFPDHFIYGHFQDWALSISHAGCCRCVPRPQLYDLFRSGQPLCDFPALLGTQKSFGCSHAMRGPSTLQGCLRFHVPRSSLPLLLLSSHCLSEAQSSSQILQLSLGSVSPPWGAALNQGTRTLCGSH